MSILAADLGGTAIKYGLWEDGSLQHTSSFPTPTTYGEMKSSLLKIYETIDKKTPLTGLALSLPGAVDTENGVIYGVSAISYLSGFEIQKDLAKTFNTKVTMENDANCAALGELHFGAGVGIKNAVVMVIGSGLGGAIIIDGKLVKGPNFFGGELGYMQIQDSTATLSELCSPVYGAKEYSIEAGLLNTIDGKDLFFRADQGDALALRYVDRIHHSLSKSIFNLMVTLNPECFLIGGAISSRPALVPQLISHTKTLLNQHGIGHIRLDIRACAFLNQANLMGAIAHFIES